MSELRDAIPLPPTTLLTHSDSVSDADAEAEAGVRTLTALFGQFRIESRVTGHVRGPAAITYSIGAGETGHIAQVISFARNIEYALPGARLISDPAGRRMAIRVPSASRRPVLLGDLLDSPTAESSHPLAAVLGADSAGNSVAVNIPDLPHLLMAGTTGSGKSTCLHSILLSVLMRSTPEQVRMLLIDTHGLELGRYRGVAHLITPVATKADRAAQALAWAVREAQTRLDDLSAAGKRHIEDFNAGVRTGKLLAPPGTAGEFRPYPLLLIAIDDLADLLRSPQRHQIQDSLLQIGTRGRMAGIHLIAATRHPQAHAVPGRLSATMPARLSFLATERAGPARNLRVGTAELTAPGKAPIGIWCSNISEREIDAVASHWQIESVAAPRPRSTPVDPALLNQAANLIVASQFGSTSMLQRKLGVGFAQAGALMDRLEHEGIVGPSEGALARSVLVRPDDLQPILDRLFAQGDAHAQQPERT